jgi:hypothetical protein
MLRSLQARRVENSNLSPCDSLGPPAFETKDEKMSDPISQTDALIMAREVVSRGTHAMHSWDEKSAGLEFFPCAPKYWEGYADGAKRVEEKVHELVPRPSAKLTEEGLDVMIKEILSKEPRAATSVLSAAAREGASRGMRKLRDAILREQR